MKDLLSPAALDLLRRERVGRLATADRTGRPHVVPFVYALHGGRIYFIVDEKPKAPGRALKRIENLRENPRVSLVVDVYDEDWSRLEYVLVQGSAALVEDRAEFDVVLAALRDRYPQYRKMRLEPGRNTLVRISPERAHHWRASGHGS